MPSDVVATLTPRVQVCAVGIFEANCYLIVDSETNAAALVDPGDDGERIEEMVRRSGARLEAIWLTHAHLDHVGALAHITRAWDVPVYLHAADLPVFAYAPRAAAGYGLPWEEQPTPDHEFTDRMTLSLGALRFETMHLPGHAPGHVAIHGHGMVLSGDVLFRGSVGRTDLPFCDPKALTESLARITTLPDETIVHAGHGPATRIGYEIATNPFLNGGARVRGG